MATKLTARQKDKLIEAAQNAITFTVTGRGNFPHDMLRYDICWPAHEGESNKLTKTSGPLEEARTITLRGLTGPTFARWRSFNWEVVEVSS